MVDTSRILAAPDISTLRVAVADAFDSLSVELSNAEAIADIETRVQTLEAKP